MGYTIAAEPCDLSPFGIAELATEIFAQTVTDKAPENMSEHERSGRAIVLNRMMEAAANAMYDVANRHAGWFEE